MNWLFGSTKPKKQIIVENLNNTTINLNPRLDNATEIRGNASDGEVTIHYKRGATSQKLAIAMGDTVTDDAYFIKFKEEALEIMKSRWTVNSDVMPLTVSSGTQGIQWAASFTWS